MAPTAVVAGCTGIVGLALSKRLLRDGWKVYGVSRRKQEFLPAAINHVPLDFLNEGDCKNRLGALTDVSHVFVSAWVDKQDEDENIKANEQMMINILDSFKQKLEHVVLVSGTKQYMGPFEHFTSIEAKELKSPYRESNPRLPFKNFYHQWEDVLWDRAAKRGFRWNIARPPIIIGFAPYNSMNMATSLAVYALVCKELNAPFIFPGGIKGYDVFTDHVHSDLLADNVLWQVTEPKAANQAFNVSNGDLVRWRWMWQAIAEYFEVKVEEPGPEPINMVDWAKDKESVWERLVKKHGLKPFRVTDLTSFWFVDVCLQIPTPGFSSLSKMREFGYTNYLDSEKGMLSVFDYLKKNKYIP